MPRPLSALLLLAAAAAAQEPLVAAHYFYWYRWPGEHFDQPGAPGREGHTHHFAAPEEVSYLDPAWHRQQFRDMAACGVDVALPVYWGAPGAYDRPGIAFARAGLAPMVAALDELAAADEPTVRLGLFYDTTTLRNGVRGETPPERGADLRTIGGKRLFCTTVTDYFAAVPERHWARFDGGALVVLYVSAFADGWDAALGPALRAAFAQAFPGERPCLVADASWGDIGQDHTTAWGAALSGPRVHGRVVQIGPGYDDSPVPGRHTPIRDREDGAFYEHGWQAALRARARLVLIETWNEMHEGTEICATLETGRTYLDLTRTWSDRLRAGADPGEPIALAHPQPRPRPDRSWGADAVGLLQVEADYAVDPPRRRGLREVAHEDGPLEIAGGALRSRGAGADRVTYLYFRVSDHWRFDGRADLVLELVREPGGEVWLEYDSHDAAATLDGAYTAVRADRAEERDGSVHERYLLPAARLANRQNAGADLRLVVRGRDVAVRAVRLQAKR